MHLAEYVGKRLFGRPARHAGSPTLQQQTRKLGLVYLDTPEGIYKPGVDAFERELERYGASLTDRISYEGDINRAQEQARLIISRLKDKGVTSVLFSGDPVAPIFLTQEATAQDYHPEWVVAGTALSDIDVVAQLYDQEQWSRAFGVSYLSSFLPIESGIGYSAYKTVRNDEPAFAVETIYAQMYMLALGIHMAGPNLTPETFEQGMFAYPGGTGPFGTWGFDEDSYTPTQDYRVIWYDPAATSPMNSKQGAYIEAYDGRRFKKGELPASDQPPVFQR